MRKIAVINQKGGVGKTTTAVNLGHALALTGRRVTLLDLDPQGHLSPCLGVFRPPAHGMDSVLLDGAPMEERILATRELLHLLPAGDRLGEFEAQGGGVARARILQEALQANELESDLLIMDCPPSAGLLVINAVLAADDVLIPVAGDYLSLTGLARLMGTLQKLEAMRQVPLRQWIFLSRLIPRRRLSQEVAGKLNEHFPKYFLRTAIREAAVLAECAGAGRSIFEYRSKSRSAQEFAELAEDLLQARVMQDEHKAAGDDTRSASGVDSGGAASEHTSRCANPG